VLPVSTAHPGDVRCGGRPHGRAPTKSPRGDGCSARSFKRTTVQHILTGEKTLAELSRALDISPSVLSNWKRFAEAGGVIGYGFNPSSNSRGAAHFVNKILKGAKPGDLPVAQPTQVRSGDQPEDGEGPRTFNSAETSTTGRQGHRVACSTAAASCCEQPWSARLAPAVPTEVLMRRIGLAVVLAAGLTLAPVAGEAQPGRVQLIGFLGNSTAALEAHLVGRFCESIDEIEGPSRQSRPSA